MNEYTVIGIVVAAFILAGVLSYFFTPPVKRFAHKVGAIDVPKDNRRMHKEPIPRLGGLAIFGGFLCSILVFGQLDQTMLCVLLGATIIVALGIFDDVLALGAKLKFIVQIIAAAIPVCVGGLQISLFHQPQSVFGRAVLASWLSRRSCYDHLDRRHYKCGQSDRRSGRSCCRRIVYRRNHHARCCAFDR